MKQDEELLAMGKIDRILNDMTADARRRVLAWLADRHNPADDLFAPSGGGTILTAAPIHPNNRPA